MKTKITITLIMLVVSLQSYSQGLKAFAIYDSKGKEVSYQTMIDSLKNDQVVFFGEMHNCALNHWMEQEVLKSLYSAHPDNFVIGAEMFERDNQIIMDEYLSGKIPEHSFNSEMRLWPNHSTDYAELVDFAVENNCHFVATNVPRRYAKFVTKNGLNALDSLSNTAKSFLPPLPIAYEENAQEIAMFAAMGGMMKRKSNAAYIAQSQALKDATMAWWIADAFMHGAKHFLHFNGSYHSDNHSGIISYLKKYAPSLKIGTIAACKQEDINKLGEESMGRADFIICIPINMARSY